MQRQQHAYYKNALCLQHETDSPHTQSFEEQHNNQNVQTK